MSFPLVPLAGAAVWLAAPFTDGAVLQRGARVPARSRVAGMVTLPEGLPGVFAWQGVETPLAPGANRIAR